MDPARGSDGRSADGREMPEVFRFGEIRRGGRERESTAENGSGSFTALLGLPANRAMELLHEVETGRGPLIQFADVERNQKLLDGSCFGRLPTFPSDSDLVERAARFSIFATEDSPRMPSAAVCSAEAVKTERPDSDSNPKSPPPQQRPPKRKGYCDKKNKVAARGMTRARVPIFLKLSR